jgi:hypothetical protein
MCDTLGSHTGANIADQLFDVLKDFQISSNQISYFTADNATNNDKALAVLIEHVDFDLIASRLRCTGHIFNLVYTAILFGVLDKEDLEDAQIDYSQDDSTSGTQAVADLEAILQYSSEEAQYKAMQRRGPIRKLHNLVTNIKASSARRALFESKQMEVTDESSETSHTRILRLVINRGIR